MGRAAALPKVVALVTTDRWETIRLSHGNLAAPNQLPANALTLECGNLGHVASCVDPIREGRQFAAQVDESLSVLPPTVRILRDRPFQVTLSRNVCLRNQLRFPNLDPVQRRRQTILVRLQGGEVRPLLGDVCRCLSGCESCVGIQSRCPKSQCRPEGQLPIRLAEPRSPIRGYQWRSGPPSESRFWTPPTTLRRERHVQGFSDAKSDRNAHRRMPLRSERGRHMLAPRRVGPIPVRLDSGSIVRMRWKCEPRRCRQAYRRR